MFRTVTDLVITDELEEKTPDYGINIYSNLKVVDDKKIWTSTIVGSDEVSEVTFPTGIVVDSPGEAGVHCSEFYEFDVGTQINLHSKVNALDDLSVAGAIFTDTVSTTGELLLDATSVALTADRTLKTDKIASVGSTIHMNNNVSVASGHNIASPTMYCDTLNSSTTSYVTLNAGLVVPGSRSITVQQLASDELIDNGSGTISILQNATLASGKKLVSGRVELDILAEKTTGSCITVEDKLKLSSVATDTTADQQLMIDSTGTVVKRPGTGLKRAEFFDDFSLVAVGLSFTNAINLISDKPWLLRISNTAEYEIVSDLGDGSITSANPYGDMIGCSLFRWTTPANLNQRYMGLNNGFQVSPILGKIEAEFRLNLRYLSHESIAQQDLWFGLGRSQAGTDAYFDLNGVVGFRYSHTNDYWSLVYGGVGAYTLSSITTTVLADYYTHTFKFIITGDSSPYDVEWFIDDVSVGTASVPEITRMGPRILHTYTKTNNALPSDGLGFVLDTVRVTQLYDRE